MALSIFHHSEFLSALLQEDVEQGERVSVCSRLCTSNVVSAAAALSVVGLRTREGKHVQLCRSPNT